MYTHMYMHIHMHMPHATCQAYVLVHYWFQYFSCDHVILGIETDLYHGKQCLLPPHCVLASLVEEMEGVICFMVVPAENVAIARGPFTTQGNV